MGGKGSGRPIGRPPGSDKLTREVAAKIISRMSRGYYLETAAYWAEVSPRTVYKWMAKGKKTPGVGKYGKFYSAVKKALANCTGNFHDQIVRKGKKEWTALAWVMERRFPKQYGRKEVVTVEDKGAPRQQMTIDQLVRWAERIEASEKALTDQSNGGSSDAGRVDTSGDDRSGLPDDGVGPVNQNGGEQA